MAWFADLSPCTYFAEGWAHFLRSVGWLERGKPFATGPVDTEVFVRLVEMAKHPLQPMTFMGLHICDLCLYEEEAPIIQHASVNNLFIPADGIVFVCPELIAHYMNSHWYRPPDEFCRAVLSCPPVGSMDYLDALSANGGRSLVISHRINTSATPVARRWWQIWK